MSIEEHLTSEVRRSLGDLIHQASEEQKEGTWRLVVGIIGLVVGGLIALLLVSTLGMMVVGGAGLGEVICVLVGLGGPAVLTGGLGLLALHVGVYAQWRRPVRAVRLLHRASAHRRATVIGPTAPVGLGLN